MNFHLWCFKSTQTMRHRLFTKTAVFWPAVLGFSVYAKFTGPFTCYKSWNPSHLSDPDCHSSSMVRKLGLWLLETWPVLHSCWVRLRPRVPSVRSYLGMSIIFHSQSQRSPELLFDSHVTDKETDVEKEDVFHAGSKASLPTWMLQYKEFHQKL